MIACYTSAEIRAHESALSKNGLSFEKMIENAAESIEHYLLAHFPVGSSILILCGSGNNGADGYALAKRIQTENNYQIDVFSLGNPPSTKENAFFSDGIAAVSSMKQPEKYDIILDCIFGFSFHGALPDAYCSLFDILSNLPCHRIAADLPSGVSADTGEADPHTFKADTTLAIGCYKPAHFAYPASEYCGNTVLLDIGLNNPPCASFAAVDGLPDLPKRFVRSNKGSYGTLATIAGCKNMAGASYLAGKAGYLSGVGLVKIVTPEENRIICQALLPEAVLYSYEGETPPEAILKATEHCSAVLLGPGLGKSVQAQKIVRTVLENCTLPLLLDADGLNLTVGTSLIENYKGKAVLTPHPGEAARLLGVSVESVLSSPILAAKTLAETTGSVVLLKDAHTVITDGRVCYINLSGNNGMSTAGCGDVLSGIISALMAGGMSNLDAAVAGCYIHGAAGDLAAKKHGKRSMLASHVLECIEDVLKTEQDLTAGYATLTPLPSINSTEMIKL